MGRAPFAFEAGIGSDSTVKTFEFGRTEPSIPTQLKMEKALAWRHGVIHDVLDAAEAGQTDPSEIDMDYMDGREIPEPASRAAELDDLELLTEVIRRMEGWREMLAEPRNNEPGKVLSPVPSRWDCGLAAAREIKDPKTRKS